MSTNDPLESLFHEALDPANWTEVDRLHTPTLDAVLEEGHLTLMFATGQQALLSRSDVEALTRFLDQYAHVAPLQIEDPFVGFTPHLVIGPDGPVEPGLTDEQREAAQTTMRAWQEDTAWQPEKTHISTFWADVRAYAEGRLEDIEPGLCEDLGYLAQLAMAVDAEKIPK